MLFEIGSFALGAGLSTYGKMKENELAQKQLDIYKKQNGISAQEIESQKSFLKKRQAGETAIEAGQMKIQALQTTNESKNAAIEGFQNSSSAAAMAGFSGTSGGTAFFNAGKAIAAERERNRDVNALGSDQMEIMQNQFRLNNDQYASQLQGLEFDSQILETKNELLQMEQEAQDYAASPLSYGLNFVSGGLNGLSIGASLLSSASTIGSFAQGSATPLSDSSNSTSQGILWKPKEGSLYGQNSLLFPRIPMDPSGWNGVPSEGFTGTEVRGGVGAFKNPFNQGMKGKSPLWQSSLLGGF